MNGGGDELRWGGNDISKPGRAHVVVNGCAEVVCAHCGAAAEIDAYVHIENNRIARVDVADGTHDFMATRETFIVLRH